MALRATNAVIDLTAIRNNIAQIKSCLPQNCKILVVVKGNAYGLGAVPISKMLGRVGVSYLGVAALSEAVELRKQQIGLPILMFTEGFIAEYGELLQNNVTQTVFSFKKAHEIDIVAGATDKRSDIHLKVDTGMGRVGCPYDAAFDTVMMIIRELEHTFLEGIYTHFPVAEEPTDGDNDAFTLRQIDMMSKLRSRLAAEGVHIPIFHCANSGGVLNYPTAAFDMVRVGIAAYGCHPSSQGRRLKLEHAVTFRTKVIHVKRVPAGMSISYGRKYVTGKETTIATLPVGYADGYPRALSSLGKVLIHGKEYPVAGRVCMDMLMVDVGDGPVKVEDEAVLFGRQGNASLNLEDIARSIGTVPYEIICRIAPRVPRIHVGHEEIDL
ncbi:MAG: alanine racemase [Candidatus Brocadiia bacterium]